MRELQPSKIKEVSNLRISGDKSIGHRAVLVSLLARQPLSLVNYPSGKDCQSSLAAVEALGVAIEQTDSRLVLTPPQRIEAGPDTTIDCGNSGTTTRLLAGILAGSGVEVTLTGDESLSRRPMKRIIDPLSAMGAEIAADDGHLPLRIRGARLLPFEYKLPVASAQVKSAVLLAGLASSCSVTVREETLTRDHTERLIEHLGSGIQVREIKPVLVTDPDDPRKRRMEMPEPFKKEITLSSRAAIDGGEVDIPGDISTASFFLAAAAIAGKTVKVENLGLNPTRTGFLDHLKAIGCQVEISGKTTISGEPRGTVAVTGGRLKARRIAGETTVDLIDEIPVVAVMAAFAEGTTVIRDAAELRVKESDRLSATIDNLKRAGVKCGLLEDGLAVDGGHEYEGADFQSYGDHRIAMACAIMSLFLIGPSSLDDDGAVSISCPEFFSLIDAIKA